MNSFNPSCPGRHRYHPIYWYRQLKIIDPITILDLFALHFADRSICSDHFSTDYSVLSWKGKLFKEMKDIQKGNEQDFNFELKS